MIRSRSVVQRLTIMYLRILFSSNLFGSDKYGKLIHVRQKSDIAHTLMEHNNLHSK